MNAPLIIVSGLPRSGTSLLMQMLAAGGVGVWDDGTRAPDASNPRGYYEVERVKRLHRESDKSWLAEGSGRALKVISFLLEFLPDTHSYQLIFMQRPLGEIFASQNRMLDQLGRERGDANKASLIQSYEGHLAAVRKLIASRACFSTLPVNYHDVLSQPMVEAVRIAGFLGRELDTVRMARAVDPALYRNRE